MLSGDTPHGFETSFACPCAAAEVRVHVSRRAVNHQPNDVRQLRVACVRQTLRET